MIKNISKVAFAVVGAAGAYLIVADAATVTSALSTVRRWK